MWETRHEGERMTHQVSLRSAQNYDEWRQAARESDERTGKAAWKKVDASPLYDHKTIRFRLDELLEIRASGDFRKVLFYVKEGLHGNMGGIGSPALYRHARFGTKDLVHQYIEEVASVIEEVAAAPEEDLPLSEKVHVLERSSSCFGRTALMFSGAGSLGPFHLGVARALHEQRLLPKVLSGASAGSLVCGVLGTRNDEELDELLLGDELGDLFDLLDQEHKIGQQMRTEDVIDVIHSLVPDMTFEEAFEHSGRYINVSVSPSELFQRARLLNAVTSPNALLREAIQASCAVPGIFRPVTLAARRVDGTRAPYVRSRTWVDGSVTHDQPRDRLARLYSVNHFISSQANPIVLWTLRDTNWENSFASRLWEVQQIATKEWMRATYPFAVQMTRNIFPLNVATRFGYGDATQHYTADINILPKRRFWDPRKLLAVLSEEETLELIQLGEKATWPKIEMIRNCTLVSRTLDRVLAECHAELEERGESLPKGASRRAAS
ncbi:MAG: DUF3336 domain-containing protein [Acidobacteriota bacterium]